MRDKLDASPVFRVGAVRTHSGQLFIFGVRRLDVLLSAVLLHNFADNNNTVNTLCRLANQPRVSKNVCARDVGRVVDGEGSVRLSPHVS